MLGITDVVATGNDLEVTVEDIRETLYPARHPHLLVDAVLPAVRRVAAADGRTDRV